jgi:hypothetical protein
MNSTNNSAGPTQPWSPPPGPPSHSHNSFAATNTHTNNHTIVELRKIQSIYETKIFKIVDHLDAHASGRSSDYKECENISRHAAKICARWKRLTSLTVEALVELDHEIMKEEQEKYQLDAQMTELSQSTSHSSQPNDIEKLQQVLRLVQHFVERTEQHSSQLQRQQR